MRTRLRSALLFSCLLPACAGDPEGATATDDPSAGPTGAVTADTTDPTTPATEPTTSEPTTSETTTSETTSGVTTTSETTTSGTTTSETTTTTTSDTGTADTGTDSSTGDPGGLGPAAQAALEALEDAIAGVTYPSESDYPWTAFALADAAPVTEADVKQAIAGVYVAHDEPALVDRAVELRSLAQLMDPLTVMQDWWTDDEVMRAADYQQIRDVLAGSLTNIQVFRFGEKFGDALMGAVDVFVLGETADGDLVGMFTISVET